VAASHHQNSKYQKDVIT